LVLSFGLELLLSWEILVSQNTETWGTIRQLSYVRYKAGQSGSQGPMLLTPESSPGCNTEHCGGRQQAQIDRLLDPPAGDDPLTRRRNLRGTGRYMFPPPLASLSGFRGPVGTSARRPTPQRPSSVDAERWLRAPASPRWVRSRQRWRPTRPG